MKNNRWTVPFAAAVAFLCGAGLATAAPYGPEGRSIRWVQPDGKAIDLRVFGDEYYARTETPDGFTVVHSRGDNSYRYASLAADGSALLATGPQVGAGPAPAVEKHLDLPAERVRDLVRQRRERTDFARIAKWQARVKAVAKVRNAGGGAPLSGAQVKAAKIAAAPVNGDLRGLTILAQFPDDPATQGNDPVNFPTPRAKVIRFCNEAGYTDDGNSGSVRDYFYDQSLGALNYTQTVTQVVTLPQPRAYYNFSDYPRNRTVRPDAGEAGQMLLRDALRVLTDDGFDFSSLTLDADGNVLATNIFFAGADSGVWAQGLWPHQSSLRPSLNVGTTANPIRINNYQITNNDNSSPAIGTFCHENGHLILDYPDLYSLGRGAGGEGVGLHCLMGAGNYLDNEHTPAPINLYFKDLVGWATVTEVAPDEYATKTLASSGNVGIRINNPANAEEFYVIENRGDGDRWARFAPDKGLAIWHIDEAVSGNIAANPHYQVSLEQADGLGQLETGANLGDSDDLFDSTTTIFKDTSKPTARWWNRKRSGVEIEALTLAGKNMRVAFGGVPPNTIIVKSPNGGEKLFPTSSYPIQWLANIRGNVKIELLKGGVLDSVIAADVEDTGRFDWAVPALAPGADYSIRISSLTNPVPATDDSDSSFVVIKGTFPQAAALPHDWKKGRGNKRWRVDDKMSYEGKASLTSGKLEDGKTAAVEYRSKFKSGQISFYIKVSSELGFDFARFYIDGVEQRLSGGTNSGLSGDVDWKFYSFDVPAGKHTFRWAYQKDDSLGELLDGVWIDGVTLPESVQEIAVTDGSGSDLVSGKGRFDFAGETLGKQSKPLEFTIHNTGKADLSGLAAVLRGNGKDFVVRGLERDFLAPGKSMTLSVIFTPRAVGTRKATLRILSNDVDEARFDIDLTGTGIGLPEIVVSQSRKRELADGKGVRAFGRTVLGSEGMTRTFTIRNDGASVLRGISLSRHGRNPRDFQVTGELSRSLKPGESMKFAVTFTPGAVGKRSASIRIRSNDRSTRNFDIRVAGTGTPKVRIRNGSEVAARAATTAAASADLPAGVSTGTEVVDGRKYLSLTLDKSAGVAGTVEVSSDLLDWSSGPRHTTVVLDTAEVLKVRDNTPSTRTAKRFIRLK